MNVVNKAGCGLWMLQWGLRLSRPAIDTEAGENGRHYLSRFAFDVSEQCHLITTVLLVLIYTVCSVVGARVCSVVGTRVHSVYCCWCNVHDVCWCLCCLFQLPWCQHTELHHQLAQWTGLQRPHSCSQVLMAEIVSVLRVIDWHSCRGCNPCRLVKPTDLTGHRASGRQLLMNFSSVL